MVTLILHSGKVVAVDSNFGVYEGIAISGDKVGAVGTTKEIRKLKGRGTEEIDLKGKSVLPGFIDTHIHQLKGGLMELRVNFDAAKSVEEVLDAIKRAAQSARPGEWIEGSAGWRPDKLREGRVPTLVELDGVSPENPVYLFPYDGHVALANSLALRQAGIGPNTKGPEGGLIGHDECGMPNGLLIERPAFMPVERLLPELTVEAKLRAISRICKKLNSVGLTSVRDAGPIHESDIQAYQLLWSEDKLTTRTSLMIRIDTRLSLEENKRRIREWGPCTGFGNGMLRLGPMKVVLDGGFEAALMREPYESDPNFFGVQQVPTEELVQLVCEANACNWQFAIHAIGGAAMDVALGAYQVADHQKPISGKRFTLEHAFFPSTETFEKCKKLGVVVSAHQPLIYCYARSMIKHWGRNRAEAANPQREWLANGVPLAGGSDYYITPCGPLLGIWSSITRKVETGEVLGADQAVSREDAIKLYTINGAYITFEERKKGSLEPGKLADLIVLSGDILSCPADEIKDLEVLMTIVAGRLVWRRPDI